MEDLALGRVEAVNPGQNGIEVGLKSKMYGLCKDDSRQRDVICVNTEAGRYLGADVVEVDCEE